VFDDLIEDVLDDVRVDEVAFGLDDFLKWHRRYYCSGAGGASQFSNVKHPS
jgi:hypothetical protein